MTAATGLAWYVDLKGPDGNAYVIMGTVARLIKQTLGPEAKEQYLRRAMSGDYENLLAVTREYVDLRELGPMIVLADASDTPDPDEVERLKGATS